MSEQPSPLTLALERLTILDLWKLLGLEGTPKPSCRSPFREDRNPSFAIYADGRRFHDHGTGLDGDAVDFLSEARNLSNADAARKLIELAGTGYKAQVYVTPKAKATSGKHHSAHSEAVEKAALRQQWPTLELPCQSEISAIVAVRGLSTEAVALAVDRGLLFCTDWKERRAWIVTDSPRINAQARRLDGEPWNEIDAKAWTLPGSVASWPIGLRETKAFPAIALVEGGPDLLAAFHFLWLAGRGDSIAPVAILGAQNRILKDALPYFQGKTVRIFEHNDADGTGPAAARRWAAQLMAAGALVDGFSFAGLTQADGSPVNDLNDFVRIDPHQWETQRNIIESAFDFVPATLTPS